LFKHIDPQWEVSAQEVKSRLDKGEDFVLLDVRQPEEADMCRIDGSHLFPLPSLQQQVEEIRGLTNGRPIVTYCHHGHRSVQAAAILRESGLGRVMSMAGGIDSWSVTVDASVGRY